MNWRIDWREKDGIATHANGASFLVSRSGWISVQEAAGQSDDALRALIAELHEVLANVSQRGDVLH
ncbi:MAG: hypothetical protein ACREXY_14185 [Gammaproteobacteria bacterium]